jgi:hypothetical protein
VNEAVTLGPVGTALFSILGMVGIGAIITPAVILFIERDWFWLVFYVLLIVGCVSAYFALIYGW